MNTIGRFIFLLVAVALTVSACKPGDEWEQDCNRCTCSDDGGAICTKRLCGNEPRTEIKLSKRSTPTACKPGDVWEQDCNRCTCSDDGGPICTKRLCGDGRGIIVNIPRDRREACKPGDVWQQDCNRCDCSPEGRAICTRRLCPFNPEAATQRSKRDTPEKCVPGAEWKDRCRWCWCDDDGTPSCGRIACDTLSPSRRRRTAYSPERQKRACVPGTRWKDECDNVCFCTSEGSARCTEMGCIKKH